VGHGSNEQQDQSATGDVTPDEIAARRFPVVFRGYDRAAVGHFLERVAEAHRSALAELAAVPVVQEPTRAPAPPPPPPPAPEAVVPSPPAGDAPATNFDEELAGVVQETRERVMAIEDLAQRRADATIARAELDAARIEADAQARADRLLEAGVRLTARLTDAQAELARVLDSIGVVDDDRVIDLSDVGTAGTPGEASSGVAPIDPPPSAGRTGVATLTSPRVADPDTLSDAPLDESGGAGEDDATFDRMVRDALERAVRLGRTPPHDT
jgi:DivIVA domain-containing protein